MYSFLEAFSSTANTSGFKTFGRDLEESIDDFSNAVFKDGTVNNTRKKYIVAMPGQFQPFHKGHLLTYRLLRRMFGDESIYILPSAYKSLPFSPLSFEDRKTLILSSNELTLHPSHIMPRKSRGFDYIGLAKDLGIINDMEDYIFICVLSVEDARLMPIKDKITYYQPWPSELYNATPEELIMVSSHLPSVDRYAFQFTVDAYSAEVIYDFDKKTRDSNFIKQQILIEMGFGLIKDKAEEDKLEDLQKYLPYDIKLLEDMRDDLLGINSIEVSDEEQNNEIEIKKDIIQNFNLDGKTNGIV